MNVNKNNVTNEIKVARIVQSDGVKVHYSSVKMYLNKSEKYRYYLLYTIT